MKALTRNDSSIVRRLSIAALVALQFFAINYLIYRCTNRQPMLSGENGAKIFGTLVYLGTPSSILRIWVYLTTLLFGPLATVDYLVPNSDSQKMHETFKHLRFEFIYQIVSKSKVPGISGTIEDSVRLFVFSLLIGFLFIPALVLSLVMLSAAFVACITVFSFSGKAYDASVYFYDSFRTAQLQSKAASCQSTCYRLGYRHNEIEVSGFGSCTCK